MQERKRSYSVSWVGASTVTVTATANTAKQATAQLNVISAKLLADFLQQVAEYELATADMTITINQNLILTSPVIIPANVNGAALIVTSANPQNPVTLTRGVAEYLFTVAEGAKLVLKNIVINGNKFFIRTIYFHLYALTASIS